ncbi:hypothetical protein FQA39_LY19380 [Lamprigera yunnana]|nr:hypothetical protein FQA39_LY19380 [Lamprigera yunnana]
MACQGLMAMAIDRACPAPATAGLTWSSSPTGHAAACLSNRSQSGGGRIASAATGGVVAVGHDAFVDDFAAQALQHARRRKRSGCCVDSAYRQVCGCHIAGHDQLVAGREQRHARAPGHLQAGRSPMLAARPLSSAGARRVACGDCMVLSVDADLASCSAYLMSVPRALCAFDIGFVELHGDAEGDGAHQGDFVRGVHAFDVEGGVGLGIAQALGFFEHHVKVQALVAHFGQDEVGGAVDDAGDPLDLVGRQPLAQRFDDGDATGHRRLIKATITPFSAAALKISVPCTASSALLAVTTCLPAAMASSTSALAMP